MQYYFYHCILSNDYILDYLVNPQMLSIQNFSQVNCLVKILAKNLIEYILEEKSNREKKRIWEGTLNHIYSQGIFLAPVFLTHAPKKEKKII